MSEENWIVAPEECIGALTMDDVRLDQLRQAIFERVTSLEQIPALLKQLGDTDWVRWRGDTGARVTTCANCNRFMRMDDAVTSDLPWLGESLFCHECAEQLRAEHTYRCDVCQHEFLARQRPAPFNVCSECDTPGVAFALSSLWAQLQRARRLDLPATLTPREWLDTLEYFGWRCAYCLRSDFACLDHYVPVVQGGGTTQANCVPACMSCNSAKGGRAPQGYLIKASAFTRVAEFLAQFSE